MLKSYWAELMDPKDPLIKIRQQGWERFESIGLPKPKQEAFQYVKKEFHFPSLATQASTNMEKQAGIVFKNGFFLPEYSQVNSPIICLPLDQAFHPYGLFLQNRITKVSGEETDPFAALNSAFHGKGLFLYVPPKCKAALHLTHFFEGDLLTCPRVHIYLGKNAQLELRQMGEQKKGFCNGFLDFALEEGASLNFLDFAEGGVQAVRSTLKRDSRLKVLLLGQKLRTSLKSALLEENSEVEVLGLSRLQEEQETHIHITMEHRAPNTRSRQHLKSVLKDRSCFSFEGKIYVADVAQKTQSYQLCNTLLLSDLASANAKPNLEIFADDVKASHGATVGQLDEEHLFYLRSRGLTLVEAKEWLIEGFCKEILDHAR